MNAIYIMLPMALLLGLGFMAAFIWMAAKGQYDDLETPPHRMLLGEETARISPDPRNERRNT